MSYLVHRMAAASLEPVHSLAEREQPDRWRPLYRGLLAFLTLAIPLALPAVFLHLLQTQPYTGIHLNPFDRVLHVEAGSPGAAAGLRPGDQLQVESDSPVSSLLTQARPGERFDVVVLRAGEQMPLTLWPTVTPPAQWWVIGWPLISALIYWATALRLLLGIRPLNHNVRRFALFAYLSAALLIVGRLASSHPFVTIMFLMLEVGVSLSLVRFHTDFPRRASSERLQRLVRFQQRGGFGLLGLLLLSVAITAAQPGAALLASLGSLVLAFDLASLVLAGTLWIHVYIFSNFQLARSRIRLVAVASLIVFASQLVLLMTIFLPSTSGAELINLIVTRGALVVQVLVPLAYGVAIRRDDFHAIDKAINRAFVYSLALAVLIGLHLAAVFVLMVLIGQQAGESLIIHSLLGALLAVFFAPIRDRMDRAMNRVFYGLSVNHWKAAERIGKALMRSTTEEEVAEWLVREGASLFDALGATLILHREKVGWQCAASRGAGHTPDQVRALGIIAAHLSRPEVLRAHQLHRLAPGAALDARNLPQDGIGAVFVHANETLGVLWLSAKSSGDNYTMHDIRLLEQLIAPGALALVHTRLNAALKKRTVELQYLYNEVVRLDELVRQELARDLHDHIIQLIYGELYRLQSHRARYTGAIGDDLRHVERTLEQLLHGLRQICQGLRPHVLEELGLSAALRELADHQQEVLGPSCALTVHVVDLDQRLAPEIENGLYAIARSALVNAVRHSQARQIELHLEQHEGDIWLTVSDNGVGFVIPADSTELLRKGSFGLVSMHERAAMIGAKLAITSTPGIGTRVRVHWSRSQEQPAGTGHTGHISLPAR
jgi:signal transduction histidine kinase